MALRVMTFNVQLPSRIMALGQFQDNRAKERADVLCDVLLGLAERDRPDVMVFNEVFHEGARAILVDRLRLRWPYIEQKLDAGEAGEDSGLMLLSSLPLLPLPGGETVAFERYRARTDTDAWAGKGIAVARVDTVAHPCFIAFTHCQASYDAANSEHREVREDQLRQAVDFLGRTLKSEPANLGNTIFVGDLNIKGDREATTDEWPQIFTSGTSAFGILFEDGWQTHMNRAPGAPDGDPGFTQRALDSGQLNRLDYQCFKILAPASRQLVPHHLYTPLRELSDHWSLESVVQLRSPNCTPRTAVDILGNPPVQGTDGIHVYSQVRMQTLTVAHAGSYQWLYVARPGTYSLFNDLGFEIALYAEEDLTFPLRALDSAAIGAFPDAVRIPLEEHGVLQPKGRTLIARTPFFVRLRAASETVTGACLFALVTHRGDTRETAIGLPPHVEVDPELPLGQKLGADDLCWFRAELIRKIDGEPYDTPFRVRNPAQVTVELQVTDAVPAILDGPVVSGASEFTISHANGGAVAETVFLRLRRASWNDTLFSLMHQSPLSFVWLRQPLGLRIDEETGPDWPGSDTLRLELSADEAQLIGETWDDADEEEYWPALPEKIRKAAVALGSPPSDLAFAGDLVISVVKLDGLAAHGSASEVISALAPADASTAQRQKTLWIRDPLGDGAVRFFCTLSRFPSDRES